MARVDDYNLRQLRQLAWESAYDASLLSKQLKISRRQLERSTLKLFGLSPQNWLNEERLAKAAGLLRKHRLVKYVAFQLGFKQVSHFSAQFKQYYGLSPNAFLAWCDREASCGNSQFIQNNRLEQPAAYEIGR
jgi:AraC-like DNA-binding protein